MRKMPLWNFDLRALYWRTMGCHNAIEAIVDTVRVDVRESFHHIE